MLEHNSSCTGVTDAVPNTGLRVRMLSRQYAPMFPGQRGSKNLEWNTRRRHAEDTADVTLYPIESV